MRISNYYIRSRSLFYHLPTLSHVLSKERQLTVETVLCTLEKSSYVISFASSKPQNYYDLGNFVVKCMILHERCILADFDHRIVLSSVTMIFLSERRKSQVIE